MLDLNRVKNFNWRSLKKYASPKATADLNDFLEKLPQNTGQTILIIAGIAWAAAAGMGLYTTLQLQKLTELRTAMQEAEALKPVVPVVTDVAIDSKEVTEFVDKITKVYKDLSIKVSGSTIVITAKSTGLFGQFREAIGHVQNGGSGWRVSIERLCVGRECGSDPLTASLKINKVSVSQPG
jgi:hypothetical protein